MNKKPFNSIISINPYSNTYYENKNSKLKKVQTPKFSRKSFYISFLATNRYITSQIDINRNIPDEDIRDAIETKAYEELGLDQTKEYKIDILEIPTLPTDKERKFHIFVADPNDIKEDFSEITQKIPYIDIITPLPLLFKYIYQRGIIDNIGVDCFIYFQKNDAFLTIYQEGRYVYSKSLKYSFKEMSDRFSEIRGERVEEDEFVRLLSGEGLKTSNFDIQESLMKLFNEIFLHINDVLIFAKRTNEIEKIDKLYISSEYGYISGLEEYAQTYLGIRAFELSFDYGFHTDEPFIDEMHQLLQLAALIILEENEEIPNLTIFKRPPPIWKRPSGQLIAVATASILISFSYPLYNIAYNYKLKFDINSLNKKYYKIHRERERLENSINSLRKEKKSILAKIKKENQIFNKRMAILNNIYNKKVNYPMKGKIISELSQDLLRYGVKIKSIISKENEIKWNVISNDDKKITNFINFISHKKNDKYHIDTKKIQKDGNTTEYISTLKVIVK